MLIESIKDYAAMSSVGASILFEEAMRKIAKGERFNLGLATGNTMITLYDELAAKFNAVGADLSLLSTWNLDEYSLDGRAAVPHDHPLSYWKYMHERLFSKFDPARGFREENAHFPDPAAPDGYDPAIAAAGGLDLQLLGIGFNGHIAFNEPMREDEISVGAFAALPTRTRQQWAWRRFLRRKSAFFSPASPSRPRRSTRSSRATEPRRRSSPPRICGGIRISGLSTLRTRF